MKSRILACLAILAGLWIFAEYFFEKNPDAEVCRKILAAAASQHGRIDILERMAKLDAGGRFEKEINSELIFSLEKSQKLSKSASLLKSDNFEPETLAFKRLTDEMQNPKSNKFTFENIGQSIPLKNEALRAEAYVILARCFFDAGKIREYKICMDIAFSILERLGKTQANRAYLAAAENAVNADDPENFLRFCLAANPSTDKTLLIYSAISSKNIAARLSEIVRKKNPPQEFSEMLSAFRNTVNIKDTIKKSGFAEVEKRFIYLGLNFNMSWKIKKWVDFRLPLLFFIADTLNSENDAKRFLSSASAPRQFYEMRGALCEYAEYAAKAFAMRGKWRDAIDAVRAIKNPRLRMRVLKFCIAQIAKNPQSLDELETLVR